ncbi:hypothetical protein BKG81_05470 [Mycobacteroides chelonae]|nr:hypothetical protein BKG81_05470 [Mycobacteroides chelonae]
MPDITNPLLEELKVPRDVLERLTPQESALLLGLLCKATRAHRKSLDRATDDLLKVLPRIPRPAARKILFGR